MLRKRHSRLSARKIFGNEDARGQTESRSRSDIDDRLPDCHIHTAGSSGGPIHVKGL